MIKLEIARYKNDHYRVSKKTKLEGVVNLHTDLKCFTLIY